MKRVTFLSMLIFWLTLPLSCHAEIFINEIYPVPASEQNEWIELFNNTESEVSTTGYKLTDNKNNTITIPETTMLPHTYIIATSHTTLNNTGDTVNLVANGLPLESIEYPSGIPEASSYVRCNNTWIISSFQTAGGSNDPACNATPSATLSPSILPTPTLLPDDVSSNIYISEFLPTPPTGEREFVELYNGNEFSIQLDNYFIDDTENSGSSPRPFSTLLEPHGYGVIYLDTSIFNSDADVVRVLSPQKKQLWYASYSSTVKAESWGVQSDTRSFCVQDPSPADMNNPCDVTATPSPRPSPSSTIPPPTATLAKPTTSAKPTPTKPKSTGTVLAGMTTIHSYSLSPTAIDTTPPYSPHKKTVATPLDRKKLILIDSVGVVILILIIGSVSIRIHKNGLIYETEELLTE